jgi:hypothetical protein
LPVIKSTCNILSAYPCMMSSSKRIFYCMIREFDGQQVWPAIARQFLRAQVTHRNHPFL